MEKRRLRTGNKYIVSPLFVKSIVISFVSKLKKVKIMKKKKFGAVESSVVLFLQTSTRKIAQTHAKTKKHKCPNCTGTKCT